MAMYTVGAIHQSCEQENRLILWGGKRTRPRFFFEKTLFL
jgi:hypothetical protein